jgi:lipopolysaccharide export system protein LptA
LSSFFARGLWADSSEPPVVPLSTASLTCDYLEFLSSENVVVARGNAVAISSGTHLQSDEMTLYLSSQVVVAKGHAVLLSSTTRLESDELRLDQVNKEATARGKMYLQDQTLTLQGDYAHYNWGASTGQFHNVYIQEGPWRTWGRTLERLGPTTYRIRRSAFSSCELNPPHYHFRGKTAFYRVNERMSVTHIRSAADNTPFLYFPYYTRSLKDNRWSYTIEPGNSERNGLFAKNVFTYPIGNHAQAKLLYDYYSDAGNGFGAEYTYSTATARGSVSGYQIDDRIDGRRRWNLRFAHWQQLAPRWQVQSRVAMQSDQNVNDVFIGDDYQRVRQLGESDVAFTRSGSWYSARIFAEHNRALDSPTTIDTSPTKRFCRNWGFNLPRCGSKSRTSTSISGAIFATSTIGPSVNSAPEGATDPLVPGLDHFRQFADAVGRFSWRLPITKTISLEPSAGVTENWQSSQVKGQELDPANVLQGSGQTGLNLRHRVTRNLDYDFGHRYSVRWKPNTFRRDHAADDHGTTENALSLFANYRPSREVWGRASTGYDLRDTSPYRTPRQRFTPPSAELGYQPRRWFSLNAREVVQLSPARKPQSTVVDVRVGPDDKLFFSAGLSYNIVRPGELDLSNGAAFHLTRGWWLSGDIRSTAAGAGGMRYNSLDVREKNLVVRRDLHCWVVRVTYKDRPGSHELFFRLDLKSSLDMRAKTPVVDDTQYYPARPKAE